MLKRTAIDAGDEGYDEDFGWGRLNAGSPFSTLLNDHVYNGRIYRFMEERWIGDPYDELIEVYHDNVDFYGDARLPRIPHGYEAYCYRAIYYVTYPKTFSVFMGAWGNRFSSPGQHAFESTPWSAANPNYTTGYCQVVSGTETAEGCHLAGYFFYVNINGQWRWFPNHPYDETYLNYSVWGIPNGQPTRPEGDGKLSGADIVFNEKRCYPNPSNSGFTFTYESKSEQHLDISIFDIQGRKVKNLFSGRQPRGQYTIKWDTRNDTGIESPSGLYFLKIETKNQSRIERMVLVK